ncbi:uncharacterized protein LOC143039848 [Oratosquilla oratoria]|uniref:uncharacterized protein LOC143039848 n=1 Tax=Oratosquilla oratoria TaxID=337810 RepID=UPI003F775ADB
MAFHGILQRASSFLGLSPMEVNKPNVEDGDIVFCKNNVCVHPPSNHRSEGSTLHHPGYLVVKCQEDRAIGSTLYLTWIPNDKLRKNHDLISLHNYDGSSRSNSPMPAADGESLSVKSLPIEETDNLNRKTSADGLRSASTSGISSADTISEATRSKDESSPQSEDLPGTDESDQSPSDGDIRSKSVEERVDFKDKVDIKCNSLKSDVKDVAQDSVTSDDAVLLNHDEDKIRVEMDLKSLDQALNEEGYASADTKDLEESISEDRCTGGNEQDSDGLIAEDTTLPSSLPSSSSIPSTSSLPVTGLEKEHERQRYISSSESSCEGEKLECSNRDVGSGGISISGDLTVGEEANSISSSPDLQVSPTSTFFQMKNSTTYWYDGSAESMAYSANLAFPESSMSSSFCPTPVDGGSSPIKRSHKCGLFSVDLGGR